ncbi:MAG: AMP-binding protein, partial [Acidimicrobiales bacterium]
MLSTMQDVPLSITQLLRHGQRVHGHSRVHTFDGQQLRSATFAEVAERTERLAKALRRLGVADSTPGGTLDGERVATFMWNTQEHLEAYFAVPGIGAVLHTLNLRLFPDQLTHIVNEAEDRVILVHSTVAPLLARVAADLKPVQHVVLVNDGAPLADDVAAALAQIGEVHDYERLLAAEEPGIDWPEVDEWGAAAMCYTSGTTGDPKGVVYSHRSTVLHAFAVNNAGGVHLESNDSVLVVVPMFHVNAWGHPYAAWMLGAEVVLPARFLQGEP